MSDKLPVSGARRFMCAGAAFAALALLVATPVAGQSADVQQLYNRLNRIERDMNLLQQQFYGGQGTSGTGAQTGSYTPAAAAQIQLQLDQLETALRVLTGQIEEISFEQRQLRDRLDKMVTDVDFRLRTLEQAQAQTAAVAPGATATTGSAGLTSPAPSQTLPTPGAVSLAPAPSVLPGGTPEEQYRYAFSLLQQAEYIEAETALRAFLAAHPEHPRAVNAQYWLGEAYYVRKDFTQAAITFAEGYNKFPTGTKAPDNLLKLAMSLANLAKSREACASLAQLAKQFPTASASIKRRAATEERRLNCS